MPELPEVETIARNLREGNSQVPSVMGMRVTGAEVFWTRTIAQPDSKAFVTLVRGQEIRGVSRRAKYLVFELSEDYMLVHLRMSGDLILCPAGESCANHVRMRLQLDRDWQLDFNNPRKFGRVWLLEDPADLFSSLGPEPFDPTLTPEGFFASLSRRKRQIKPLLLDQGFIAGMGNIYTDEALNLAKIHPLTRADELDQEQADLLLESIRRVLNDGIRRNGASIDWVYQGGDFQNYFRVYQRTGEPCPDCGTPVERIVVGQRGTHLCPQCQTLG
ncbi:MAG: bifunctional DNA-formamidopyrimidine glycosylase/DNA-(apurinic or apyrimidinic site) lyase [Anaerolineales bacterium]|nr:bifunctional DNA-formamidopyrimidine glycosylase/DNA-(apurinic or apyrimidinic site) lyase [Anaerolineales bacterium]